MPGDLTALRNYFESHLDDANQDCSFDDPDRDVERVISCIEHYARADVKDLQALLYRWGPENFDRVFEEFLHRDAFIFLAHNPAGLEFYVDCLFKWALPREWDFDEFVEVFMRWWYRGNRRQLNAIYDAELKAAVKQRILYLEYEEDQKWIAEHHHLLDADSGDEDDDPADADDA